MKQVQYTAHWSLQLFALTVIFLVSGSCKGSDDNNMGEELQAIDEILQVAEQVAVNRFSIDWDEARQLMQNTYEDDGFDEAVSVFLNLLEDNRQSFFNKGNGVIISNANGSCNTDGFSLSGLDEDIGYIQMRSFIGSQPQATLYAGDRHNRARTQDKSDIKGWVVDLTTTSGGEVYPQLAALGMFFDQETLGYFVSPDEEIVFGYKDGSAYLRSPEEAQATVVDPYTLMNPEGKLIVVMDLSTAGAGEVAVLTLKDRPNTLILGRPSCGQSAVTQAFTLSNGGILVLATHFAADANKQIYSSRLQPDEQIGNSGDLIARINEWLSE